jgi:hypothetical protein
LQHIFAVCAAVSQMPLDARLSHQLFDDVGAIGQYGVYNESPFCWEPIQQFTPELRLVLGCLHQAPDDRHAVQPYSHGQELMAPILLDHDVRHIVENVKDGIPT